MCYVRIIIWNIIKSYATIYNEYFYFSSYCFNATIVIMFHFQNDINLFWNPANWTYLTDPLFLSIYAYDTPDPTKIKHIQIVIPKFWDFSSAALWIKSMWTWRIRFLRIKVKSIVRIIASENKCWTFNVPYAVTMLRHFFHPFETLTIHYLLNTP